MEYLSIHAGDFAPIPSAKVMKNSNALLSTSMETGFLPKTLVDYAQILGAIGTTAAVMLSLYLSFKRVKPLLKASCSIRLLTWYGQKDDAPRYLTIEALNVGETVATITNIGWQYRTWFKKKRWAVQDVGVSDYLVKNPSLPCKLEHGESATFFLGLQGEYDWSENLEKTGYFSGSIASRNDCERIRVVVFTSVGKPVFSKPDKEVLDFIWKHLCVYLYRTPKP